MDFGTKLFENEEFWDLMKNRKIVLYPNNILSSEQKEGFELIVDFDFENVNYNAVLRFPKRKKDDIINHIENNKFVYITMKGLSSEYQGENRPYRPIISGWGL